LAMTRIATCFSVTIRPLLSASPKTICKTIKGDD
jgi:hypothetical protein